MEPARAKRKRNNTEIHTMTDEYTYEISNVSDEYTDILANHPHQCSAFGIFYSKQHGCTQRYIRIKKDRKLILQCLYFIKGKGAEMISQIPAGKIINSVTEKVIPELRIITGPVFLTECDTEELISYMIHIICKEHHTKRVIADFTTSYGSEKWATYVVNLMKTEEELLKNVDKNARYEIRKNIDKVKVFMANDEEHLKVYEQVLKEKRENNDINYMPPAYPNKLMVDCFGDECQVFFVEYKGEIIAASGTLAFKDYIIDLGVGVGKHSDVNIGEVLKWEIMKYARKKGYKYYDFVGVVPEGQGDEKEKAIRFFKSKFGGEYKEYGVLR